MEKVKTERKGRFVIISIVVIFFLIPFGWNVKTLLTGWWGRRREEPSYLEESHSPLSPRKKDERKDKENLTTVEKAHRLLGLAYQKQGTKKKKSSTKKKTRRIVFASQAVIVHPEEKAQKPFSLPTGATAIGKTLNTVDTRDPSAVVRVQLPHGWGVYKIPKNSVLLGAAFPRGNRLFMQFQKLVTPNGSEMPIQAQALDPKDFRAGVTGTRHGRTGLKIAAGLGASMIGGITETLAKKEGVGGIYGGVEVRSKFSDAALVGISRVAEKEAARHAQEAQEEAEREYLTLEANTALIILLTEGLKGGTKQ